MKNPRGFRAPFELNRTGMVVGEGAATLVLEELESARARNAKIIGEVVGYGSSTVMDRHAVGHRDEALKNAIVQALNTAGHVDTRRGAHQRPWAWDSTMRCGGGESDPNGFRRSIGPNSCDGGKKLFWKSGSRRGND